MADTLHIKIKKLDERAVIPSYAHEKGDVGMDLTAIDVEYDVEKDMYIYHTGLAFEGSENFVQYLFPRSSNCKKECYLTNSVGVVDPSYRGEIQFRFKLRDSLKTIATTEAMNYAVITAMVSDNNFDAFMEAYTEKYDETVENAKNLEFAPYNIGDRIGQMVFMDYPSVELELVDELSDTERGDGGFGSTDKK